jgi:hypothetical protein
MRTLLVLSLLSLVVFTSTGCFHRNACCGVGSGGLFGWRPQQPTANVVQYCDPCCQPQQVQCCQPVQAPCCP